MGARIPSHLGRAGYTRFHSLDLANDNAERRSLFPPLIDHWLYQPSRLSTACGSWLAWASMAVPACCMIWFLVRLADSAAKSVSMIRLRAADTFSEMFCRLLMVDSKRFCTAPMSARWESIPFSAASITSIACCAPSAVVILILATEFTSELALAAPNTSSLAPDILKALALSS